LTFSKFVKFTIWQVQKSISLKVDEFKSRRFEVSKLSWVMTTSVVYEWADPVATTNWPSWHQTGKGWVLGRYSKTLLRPKFIPWDKGPILWNFLRSQLTNVCNKLVHGKPFQPSLMFVRKTCSGRLLTLPTIIRLAWKYLRNRNTLAYYEHS
jgi:hypothetical protein